MSANESTVEAGDVVQIDPAHDAVFGACLMVVTEPKSWGAQGYVLIPEPGGAKAAFYRCKHENMAPVGKAEWIWEEDA